MAYPDNGRMIFLNFERVSKVMSVCESRPRGLSVPLPPMRTAFGAKKLTKLRAAESILVPIHGENGRGAAVATRYFTRIRGRTGAAAPREHGPHAAATFSGAAAPA